MEPCPLCMGAIYMMGIRHLHYAARDSYAGSTNLLGTTPYMMKKEIHVFGPADSDLEKALIALVVLFDQQRKDYSTNPKIGEVIEAWHTTCPNGVELGKKLSRTSTYSELTQSNTPAETGFNFLFSELISG
jgi:tRNA(adenine34) deaminase